MMAAQMAPLPLPLGISEAQVDCTSTCGLSFHILEAGRPAGDSQRPLVLLVHGFPELAFSWRKVMPSLASAGNHVVAVDQRGFGRTTGWDTSDFDRVDMRQFSLQSMVRDLVALVYALGYTSVKCIVGHDVGGSVVAYCALMRPDLFSSCVMMSHPFPGSPSLPVDGSRHGDDQARTVMAKEDIQKTLASLQVPRKHYRYYNSTQPAASQWSAPAQGLAQFLRGYMHLKSADWEQNKPFPLQCYTAPELAKMPHYYIMPLDATMPDVVALNMAREDPEKTKRWLSDEELDVYVAEWSRTGFQGGLNWYRRGTTVNASDEVLLFAGKKIEVPCTFLSGAQDWGNFQEPGALESYPKNCTDYRGATMIEGAGHWPQQEQPEKVVDAILGFMQSL